MMQILIRRFRISEEMFSDKGAFEIWSFAEKQVCRIDVRERRGILVGESQVFVNPKISEKDRAHEGMIVTVADFPHLDESEAISLSDVNPRT